LYMAAFLLITNQITEENCANQILLPES
jgi:hypothetical protein